MTSPRVNLEPTKDPDSEEKSAPESSKNKKLFQKPMLGFFMSAIPKSLDEGKKKTNFRIRAERGQKLNRSNILVRTMDNGAHSQFVRLNS
jgi:hypothetical protein